MTKTLLFGISAVAGAALALPSQAAWTNTQSERIANSIAMDPTPSAAASNGQFVQGNSTSALRQDFGRPTDAAAVAGSTTPPGAANVDSPSYRQYREGLRRSGDPLRNYGAEGGQSGGKSSDSPGV